MSGGARNAHVGDLAALGDRQPDRRPRCRRQRVRRDARGQRSGPFGRRRRDGRCAARSRRRCDCGASPLAARSGDRPDGVDLAREFHPGQGPRARHARRPRFRGDRTHVHRRRAASRLSTPRCRAIAAAGAFRQPNRRARGLRRRCARPRAALRRRASHRLRRASRRRTGCAGSAALRARRGRARAHGA